MQIGVITNPRSRANQGNPRLHRALVDALDGAGRIAAPESLDELAQILAGWRADGIRTIAVNGGDGTVHRVATGVVRTWGASDRPTVAILPAGTMNIVANSIGVRGRPATVLRRLLEAGPEPPTRTVWTMEVTGAGEPVYGFLFGNGIIARFLEVYYEGSEPTPAKAAWILGRGAASAFINGPAIRRLTKPFAGTLTADGKTEPETSWTAIAAGTVQQIGLGFKAFYLAPENPGHLHAIGIAGSVLDLARDLPRVYRGVPLARPGNRGFRAQELRIESDETIGYMVDGDFYQAEGMVRVAVGPALELATP